MLEKLGKHAFQAAAPHLWNELPLQLLDINSLGILRTQPEHSFLYNFFEKIILIFNISLCDFNTSYELLYY